METLKKICLVLIIIGAINWAFVGLFEVDLVASVFGGSDELLARIVYIIIGIAGIIDISILLKKRFINESLFLIIRCNSYFNFFRL